jgi:hypothetical protein
MLGADSIAGALASSHPATLVHIIATAGGVVAALAERAGWQYGAREHVDFVAQLLTGMTGLNVSKVRGSFVVFSTCDSIDVLL